MAVDIRVFGDKDLQKQLKKLPDRLQNRILKQAIKKGAKITLQRTKTIVPKETGRLSESLKVKPIKRSRVKIGYQVLTGTREELGIPAGKKGYYPMAIETGTKNRPAKPYMRPALDQTENQVLGVIKGAIKSKLDKEARKK